MSAYQRENVRGIQMSACQRKNVQVQGQEKLARTLGSKNSYVLGGWICGCISRKTFKLKNLALLPKGNAYDARLC